MDAIESILNRKSCRNYDGKQISDMDLNKILEAGFSAPITSGKYDSLHITVIQNEEILKTIFNKASELVFNLLQVKKNMDFGAKTLIVVSSLPTKNVSGIEYANAGCILENMVIAATSIGIDSIIWGAPSSVISQSDELKKKLEIPEGFNPLLCASFGYAITNEKSKKHIIDINIIK